MTSFQKTLLIAGLFICCFTSLGMLYQEVMDIARFFKSTQQQIPTSFSVTTKVDLVTSA